MKRSSIIFLRAVIVLIGIGVLAGMIRFPLIEGRAANLDLFHIYWDPFIWYAYVASIPFFVSLFQAFKLLGLIGKNKVFSLNSVRALRTIKYSAITEIAAILIAVVYIRMFHAKDDDPAGFIALGIVAAFISVVFASAAAVAQKLLENAVDIKSENDLTV